MQNNYFSESCYEVFLKTFVNQGYSFKSFNNFEEGQNQIVLRHDIDFDTSIALKCAEFESAMNIKSNYFFLLSSDFYNVINQRTFRDIIKIKELNHNISLHFDPLIYDDFEQGFLFEKELFESLFNVDVKIISIHRPNDFFLNHNSKIMGVYHTYQDMFFKKINYYSDSSGMWRFGSPINSEDFKNGNTFHVLTHPIWWFMNGESNLEVLKNYYEYRKLGLKHSFLKNCKPFKQLYNQI